MRERSNDRTSFTEGLYAFTAIRFGLAVSALTALPASGAVVISEVVYNEVGSDTTGEWIEIYNSGPAPVDISNFKFGDEETAGGDTESGGMWQFPENTLMPSGGVWVVTVSGARFQTVYGFSADFELTGTDTNAADMRPYLAWVNPAENNNMANANDQAILLDGADAIADAVSWGNTFAFDPGLDPDAEADGQSYERKNANIDTDTADDWQLGPTSDVAAQRSTPGVVSVPEPASLGLVAAGALLALRRTRRE